MKIFSNQNVEETYLMREIRKKKLSCSAAYSEGYHLLPLEYKEIEDSA